MKNEQIVKKSYLDIIFEGRNKNYGSYELRLHYPQRMRNALISTIIAISLFAAGGLISGFITKDKKKIVIFDASGMYPKSINVESIKPNIQVQPPAPKPLKPNIVFHLPVIVKAVDVPEDPKKDAPDTKGNTLPGNGNNTGYIENAGQGNSSGPSTGTGHVTPTKPIIHPYVEQQPEPEYDLVAYLQKNLQYPDEAKQNTTQGRVILRFVVNEDGSISDIMLVRGIGSGCDEEAIRVVSSMPKWRPGKQNGTPVKVYFTQPISFKLE